MSAEYQKIASRDDQGLQDETCLSSTLLEFADTIRLLGKADGTIREYCSDIRRFLRAVQAETPTQITEQDLHTWDGYIAAHKLHPNTVRRYRVSVKLFLRFLEQHHDAPRLSHLIGDIRNRVSDPRVMHPDDLSEIITKQNEQNPVHARDAALITLFAASGLRISELVSLDCGSIFARKVEHQGKPIRIWAMRIEGVKPRFKQREINFGRADVKEDVVTRHFGLWYMKRLNRLGGYETARNYPLFADGEDDNKRLQPRSINFLIKRAAKRAGRKDIAHWIHPHSLRHYFATWFQANGGNLLVLQKHLGHANVTTTERYVHLSEKVTAAELLKANPLRDIVTKPIEHLTDDQIALLVNHMIPTTA